MATTKKKQVHKSKEEVIDEMELGEAAEQATDKACAEEIEAVFKKYNRALQPFLVNADTGIFPRVRLVRVPKPTEVDGEAEAA